LIFQAVERRKHFCEREIELNKRFTKRIYLDVQPVSEWRGRFYVGINKGAIIDYAVRMNKIDREKQMDVLLLKNKVTEFDILKLAEKIALFHKNTDIIYEGDSLDIQEKFNDLKAEEQFLQGKFGRPNGKHHYSGRRDL
jgi:aminoglycoside phosphotransferase family enzyme